jgi:chromosome segregation ATPase
VIEPSIVVSIVALLGTIAGVLANRSRSSAEARKAHAEAESTISQMAVSFAEGLRREMAELRSQHRNEMADLTTRVQELEERNFMYRRYIQMLISQLQGADIVPVKPPEPWPDRPGA